MSPDKQDKLGRDYARYCEERDQMEAQGRAIGTFIGWQYINGLSNIKIAKTWEEHRRIGIVTG